MPYSPPTVVTEEGVVSPIVGTEGRVAEVIAKKFRVTYHPAQIWKILRSLGLRWRKPQQRAPERDEAGIGWWRKQQWPWIKRKIGEPFDGFRRLMAIESTREALSRA